MKLDEFFKNKDILLLVDGLAKRYGKTPYEIVTEQTLFEFNFNTAVMMSALTIEAELQAKAYENVKKGKGHSLKTYKDFGLKRTVVKK